MDTPLFFVFLILSSVYSIENKKQNCCNSVILLCHCFYLTQADFHAAFCELSTFFVVKHGVNTLFGPVLGKMAGF